MASVSLIRTQKPTHYFIQVEDVKLFTAFVKLRELDGIDPPANVKQKGWYILADKLAKAKAFVKMARNLTQLGEVVEKKGYAKEHFLTDTEMHILMALCSQEADLPQIMVRYLINRDTIVPGAIIRWKPEDAEELGVIYDGKVLGEGGVPASLKCPPYPIMYFSAVTDRINPDFSRAEFVEKSPKSSLKEPFVVMKVDNFYVYFHAATKPTHDQVKAWIANPDAVYIVINETTVTAHITDLDYLPRIPGSKLPLELERYIMQEVVAGRGELIPIY